MNPTQRIWFVSNAGSSWRALATQLACFDSLKVQLRAGCDFCFAAAMPQSTILTRIIELYGAKLGGRNCVLTYGQA